MSTEHQTEAPAAPANVESDDLAALLAQAEAIEGGQAAPGGAGQAVAPVAAHEREAWVNLAGFALSLGLPLLAAWRGEKWAAAYGERERAAIGAALADLAHARGWTAGEVMGEAGPWLAFGGAVLGPVLPLILAEASQARRTVDAAPVVRKVEPDKPAPAPAPAPPADPAEGVVLP